MLSIPSLFRGWRGFWYRLSIPLRDGLMVVNRNRAVWQKGGTAIKEAQAYETEVLISAEKIGHLLEFAEWLLERVAGIWNSACCIKRGIGNRSGCRSLMGADH